MEIPSIVTTDAHYYTADKRQIHKAFLNSKDGDREVDDFYATTYLMKLDEVHSFMNDSVGAEAVEECAANTLKILNQIETYSLERPFKLPYLPSEKIKNWPLNRHILGRVA